MPEFFDPHFHFWDVSSSGFADSAVLFKPSGKEVYTHKDYEADLEGAGMKCTGGVYVECSSVCYVSENAAAHNKRCVAEATWTQTALRDACAVREDGSQRDYVAVLSCSLEDPDVQAALREVSAGGGECVRGIRQILNCEPNWPRQGATGDLTKSEEWKRGYSMMPEGWSFDLQANPHQLERFADIAAGQPRTPVIINHLGTPTEKDLTEGAEVYWRGMERLSSLGHVYVKISMLCYTNANWDESARVRDAVHKVIKMFGADRCMLASNYPVDNKDGWGAGRLFPAFASLLSQYTEEEQEMLWGGTARKVYRCLKQ
eukprot:TRINITY_DN14906_c0_g1_i1.p1 TRINITY_DN14906_c0_g1~~TRINITY_DN14906_c0_g1_i1.p1  ORF type:complete len:316 (+),score=69.75 TRINITY_DN14906_c0_g1_i1:58-1005(+)